MSKEREIMKKLICVLVLLTLCMSLAACGGKKAENPGVTPDLQAVYADMAPYLPDDAFAYDQEFVFNAYGVKPDDCKQQVVMSYYDGNVTAEVWLIEAVSKDALRAIKELAEIRLDSMTQQFQSYDAKATKLCEDAELFTRGNCLVLIVSEQAGRLLEVYNTAAKG